MSFVVVCIYNFVTFHDRGKGKGGRVHLNHNQGIKARPLCLVSFISEETARHEILLLYKA